MMEQMYQILRKVLTKRMVQCVAIFILICVSYLWYQESRPLVVLCKWHSLLLSNTSNIQFQLESSSSEDETLIIVITPTYKRPVRLFKRNKNKNLHKLKTNRFYKVQFINVKQIIKKHVM